MSTILYDNVSVSYGTNEKTALKNFNLQINSGEIISFIGSSGCGKSTALNVAAGLLTPTNGELVVDDLITRSPGIDRGVVFQNYSLFPWMSNLDNVLFALRQRYDLPNKTLQAKAADLLDRVGISGNFQKVYPSKISGGMQQRVAIARMFALDSPIFLMDEPFAAVDEITRKHLQSLLLDLWEKEENRKTIVMVTHNIEEAIYLSDRVVVLHEGEINSVVAIPFERHRNRREIENKSEYLMIKNHLLQAIEEKIVGGER
ncbi:ABC transporter ATP-binding protein [Trichococcus shcherbakoviae]|uniref:ABC transporter ATP-binding protein n=1 Tax=Trichococcus shcherbakoviae subsp. psychrophilus TaxID=2585775 RepID=A0A5C5E4Y4_9LACT|nr:ABC transporter ATP-binding protein [Trichococcus shcherbakoviae]TNV67845.1 ABC transporter ATP-binding protein [Trichococcus shcherbakoviae subsp. psychrophilus]